MHLKLSRHFSVVLLTLFLGIAATFLAAQEKVKSQASPKDKIRVVRLEPDGTESVKPRLQAIQGTMGRPKVVGQVQSMPVIPKVHARQNAGKEEKPKQAKGGENNG